MAGAISTYRKTALIAPVSAILTLAYYRRRELVRLAPLGVIVLVAVHLLSPGAFGAIAEQLHPTRLGAVSTVSDRTSDYDAVRPDVWTHLAFGRGYGSYEHTTYRVLDMELLRQLIEVGVVGLTAYIMLMVSIVATARAPIRRRRPDESRVALAAAATAVSFLVISTLFDVMSFPHCPYILLWMGGLLAVVVTQPPPDEPAAAPA
jgi:O-antigen ligase